MRERESLITYIIHLVHLFKWMVKQPNYKDSLYKMAACTGCIMCNSTYASTLSFLPIPSGPYIACDRFEFMLFKLI